MILYTPVPYSEIFREPPDVNLGNGPRLTLIKSGFVETDTDDKIIDLFSTDPNDYLRYPAGQLIDKKSE